MHRSMILFVSLLSEKYSHQQWTTCCEGTGAGEPEVLVASTCQNR